MSLPLAQLRRAKASAVTAPAARNAEATTSTSSTKASSTKDPPKPETMSRLPYPNYPMALENPNLTQNPSHRRSSSASHPQAYPPQYAPMLRQGPNGPVPLTSSSSLLSYAPQPVNQIQPLQPVLESIEGGSRAVRAHLEQATIASLNATNSLKEQLTDVQNTVKVLAKRLEDRDKADDARNATNLQVLNQVLTALKDLNKRVGQSGDERSVMTRLAAIEFSAGDAWEGREDPQADDSEEESNHIAESIIVPSASSKASREPSATPSKKQEDSPAHAPQNEIQVESGQLPDIEVNAPSPTTNPSLPALELQGQIEDTLIQIRSPFPATSSGAQTPAISDAMELEYPPEISFGSAMESLQYVPQQLTQVSPHQPSEVSLPSPTSPPRTPCNEHDRRLSRVDWSQENQDLGVSQHAAIFKPDNSPQAIKASSSYSPRPPMDGSVASLRLETLGDASFLGDADLVTSTPVSTKTIPLVAPPAVSPFPSPVTSRSSSPILVTSPRDEEEEVMDDVEVHSNGSIPAIEVIVEEHGEDSDDEDVEMEEEGPGATAPEVGNAQHVAEKEPSIKLEDAKVIENQPQLEDGFEGKQPDPSAVTLDDDSRSPVRDEEVHAAEEPSGTQSPSQSPLRQTGGEVSEIPLSATVSGESVAEPPSGTQVEEEEQEQPDVADGHREEQELDVGKDTVEQPGPEVESDHDVEPVPTTDEAKPLENEIQAEPEPEPEEPLFLGGDRSDSEDLTGHQDTAASHFEAGPEPTTVDDGQVNGLDPLPSSDDCFITSDVDEEELASAIWMSMQPPPSSPVKPSQEGAESRDVSVSPSKTATPRSRSILPFSSASRGPRVSPPRLSPIEEPEDKPEEMDDMEMKESEEPQPAPSASTPQSTPKASHVQTALPSEKENLGSTSLIPKEPIFGGVDIDVDSLPPPPSSSPFCYPEHPDSSKEKETIEIEQNEDSVAQSPSLDNISLGSGIYMNPEVENVDMDQDTSANDTTIIPMDDDGGGLEYVDESEPQLVAPQPRVPVILEDDDDEPPLPKPRQRYRSPSAAAAESEPEAEEMVEKVPSPRTPVKPSSSISTSPSTRRSNSKRGTSLRPPSRPASASGFGDRSPNHPVSRTLIGTPARTNSPLKSINLSTKLKKSTPRAAAPPQPPDDVIEISSSSSEHSPRVFLQQKISKQKKKMEMKKEKKARAPLSSTGGASESNDNASPSAQVIDLTMSNAEEGQSSDSEPSFNFDSDDSTEIIRGVLKRVSGADGAVPSPSKPGSSGLQAKAIAAPAQQPKRLADRLLKPGQSAAATRIKRKQRPLADGDDDRPSKRTKNGVGAPVPVIKTVKSKLLGFSRASTQGSSASGNIRGKEKDESEKDDDSSDGMIVVRREKKKEKVAAPTSVGSSSSKAPSNRSTSSSLLDDDGSRKLRHRTIDPKNNEVKWPTLNKHSSRKFQREFIKCDK